MASHSDAEVEKEDGAGEVRGCHFHGAVLMHRAENERVGSDGFVDDDESDDDADETKMEMGSSPCRPKWVFHMGAWNAPRGGRLEWVNFEEGSII
ncbi:hypothetical protein CRG98_015747 [Punica granatum]|uniref:Uncharacterized protein n=1 Tax=Punica granatum TaxID=22663 RepID=A0A2I0K5Q9_PUNGR|nr:hypothetical protein CRG98_015747 [Punica granatum]